MKDTRAKATHFTAVGPQMGEKDIKLKTVVVSEPPKICLKCPDSKSHMHRLCTLCGHECSSDQLSFDDSAFL